MGEMFLRPGTPDDDNRDYLPEKIKGSDIVVNENGNNSQPYPPLLKECHGVIADELEDEWYVYVPESYDPTKKTPLVVSLHGGMMTGWGQAIYTSWTLAADRDGFIVLFPNANYQRFWQVQWGTWEMDPEIRTPGSMEGEPPGVKACPEKVEDNHDIKMILGLIDLMKQTYNIDEGRIFMQGMSMGNIMTGQFAREYGNILAGAAGSGGPCELRNIFDKDGKIINKAGHLAIWQSRPEKNGLPPGKSYDEYTINRMNRIYWMRINECAPIPQISIVGEDNFAFYKGKKADLVYVDIKNRDHGQTLDEAFLYWDYLFSGPRRNPDGTITHEGEKLPRTGDKFAFAVTDGCDKAWFNNQVVDLKTKAIQWEKLKYHGLNGGQLVRGSYLCVPLSFIAQVFGADYESSEDGAVVVLRLKDGRRLQFARGSIGCVIDDTVRCMYCEALHRDGELLVSIEWFAKCFYSLQVSICEGVVYVTDHFADLSAFMADLIKDLLNGNMVPDNFDTML